MKRYQDGNEKSAIDYMKLFAGYDMKEITKAS
jgi:hypothetical protein